MFKFCLPLDHLRGRQKIKASKGKQKTINTRILDYRLGTIHNLEFRI